MDRRDIGSWLQGPEAITGVSGYPGERLGRPEAGPRSLARPGRRFAALIIDWVLCLLIARGFAGPGGMAGTGGSFIPVGILVLENFLLIPTAGFTVGQRLLGVHVERVDGVGGINWIKALIRAVLLALVIPPLSLAFDEDRRGLHDLLSGSVVARN